MVRIHAICWGYSIVLMQKKEKNTSNSTACTTHNARKQFAKGKLCTEAKKLSKHTLSLMSEPHL